MPDETKPVPFADVCEAVGAELTACPCQCHDAHCVPCRDQAWWAAALRALAALLRRTEAWQNAPLSEDFDHICERSEDGATLLEEFARGYVPPTTEEEDR